MDRRCLYKKNGQTITNAKENLSKARANSRAAHQDTLRELAPTKAAVQLSQQERLKQWRLERDEKKRREEALKKKPFVSAVSRGFLASDKREPNKLRRKSTLTKQADHVQNSSILARRVLAVPGSQCTPMSENKASVSYYPKRRKTWSVADKVDNLQSFVKLQSNWDRHNSPEDHQNREAAKYFRFQVDSETRNLVKLVQYWTEYKKVHEHVDSVHLDEIDVAIGQTKLLVEQKFKTLLDLCNKCWSEASQPPVRPNDLEGFWSTALTQVDDCNRKFQKLSTLKERDWLEIDVEVPKTRATRNRNPLKRATSASSGIRKMIAEARRKMEQNRKSVSSARKTSKAAVVANSTQTLQRIRPKRCGK